MLTSEEHKTSRQSGGYFEKKPKDNMVRWGPRRVNKQDQIPPLFILLVTIIYLYSVRHIKFLSEFSILWFIDNHDVAAHFNHLSQNYIVAHMFDVGTWNYSEII